MAALKFEVHVLEKSGAETVFEADTREAADDIAQRVKSDHGVEVRIVENEAFSNVGTDDIVPPLL